MPGDMDCGNLFINHICPAAKKIVDDTGYLPVPMHIRNAPTKVMKQMGYGRGYKYDHDHKGGVSGQKCLPDDLSGTLFYNPTDRGYEQAVKQRLDMIRKPASGKGKKRE